MQTYFNPLLDAFNYGVVKVLVFPPLFEFFFGALSGITVYFVLKIALRLFADLPKSVFRLLVGSIKPGV